MCSILHLCVTVDKFMQQNYMQPEASVNSKGTTSTIYSCSNLCRFYAT